MRAVSAAIAASLAGALAAGPARADISPKEMAKIRANAFTYATCVVRKHHASASDVILGTASNKAILGHFTQIIDADCLTAVTGTGTSMRFPNDTYQYALADALVNADFASHGDTSFDDRLPLAQPVTSTPDQQAQMLAKATSDKQRKELQEQIDKRNALAWVSRYGECIVRHDPVNTRYWLLTRPGVAEETSRIRVLQPVFAACLSDGTMKFNRVMMRGTVAINYYRLAMATIVPGAGNH